MASYVMYYAYGHSYVANDSALPDILTFASSLSGKWQFKSETGQYSNQISPGHDLVGQS